MPTVTLWAYPAQYTVKRIIPPQRPPELDYPTTAGPNYEGNLGGALLPPAIVRGTPRGDVAVGNVRLQVGPDEIASSAVVGVMPFKE